ncbi:MAG: leucine-rich repeat domain-containing protein, partial [Erysipelotrichaceae bacterium]|nr:leucine-rich repeat domain-containing protein [Erysipelotrichaceae bacterium]
PSSEDPPSSEAQTFTISWVNYDDAPLETDYNVPYGVTPTYDGDTPTRPEDDNYTYSWNGWFPEVVAATDDATYKATYIPIEKEPAIEVEDFIYADNIEGIVLVGYYGSEDIVVIPEAVDDVPLIAIERLAFFNNKAVREITIPDSVVSIGERAFHNCDNLETLNFGNGLKRIGKSAFVGCLSLETINLPEGVTVIEDNVFSYCPNLVTISIPNSIEEVGREIINFSPSVLVSTH